MQLVAKHHSSHECSVVKFCQSDRSLHYSTHSLIIRFLHKVVRKPPRSGKLCHTPPSTTPPPQNITRLPSCPPRKNPIPCANLQPVLEINPVQRGWILSQPRLWYHVCILMSRSSLRGRFSWGRSVGTLYQQRSCSPKEVKL